MIERVLSNAKSYLGTKQGDSRHKSIIDQYNAVKPVPSGYLVKYTDNWCAAFLTHLFDKSNLSHQLGRECGVQRFIAIFKGKKIWLAKVKPRPGDIIVFDWQRNSWADHIGLVEQVNGNQVTTIEGNISKSVARRTYAYDDGRIVGYARPKYPIVQEKRTKTEAEVAREVISGKWGNGAKRVTQLTQAGYNPKSVQSQVALQMKRSIPHLKSNEGIAKEVLQGKWSNGEARSKRLIDAGYDPVLIQKIVNQLL